MTGRWVGAAHRCTLPPGPEAPIIGVSRPLKDGDVWECRCGKRFVWRDELTVSDPSYQPQRRRFETHRSYVKRTAALPRVIFPARWVEYTGRVDEWDEPF